MPILDFLIWLLGICGLAHFFVVKDSLQDHIFWLCRKNPKSMFYRFAEKLISFKLFTCPACLALFFSFFFVDVYFNSEILLTKVFVCFTTFITALLTSRFVHADR